MKQTELTGIIHHMEAISPEAQKAQVMAEMEQLAKYRAKRLQQYKDWSNPMKRAAMRAQYNADEERDRKLLVDIPAEHVAVRPVNPYRITLTEVVKPKVVKLTWLQRVKLWLTSVLS